MKNTKKPVDEMTKAEISAEINKDPLLKKYIDYIMTLDEIEVEAETVLVKSMYDGDSTKTAFEKAAEFYRAHPRYERQAEMTLQRYKRAEAAGLTK